MDLSKLKESLDSKNSAELKMADAVLAQLNHYRDDLKELADYCLYLVDSKGNHVSVGTFKIGLFKTHKFDRKGETDGVVYLDLMNGKICVDIRDDSKDFEYEEYDIPKGPALPVTLTNSMLADCLADNSNFEMVMQATNPNTLVELAIKNSEKQVNDINKRINQFNNFQGDYYEFKIKTGQSCKKTLV